MTFFFQAHFTNSKPINLNNYSFNRLLGIYNVHEGWKWKTPYSGCRIIRHVFFYDKTSQKGGLTQTEKSKVITPWEILKLMQYRNCINVRNHYACGVYYYYYHCCPPWTSRSSYVAPVRSCFLRMYQTVDLAPNVLLSLSDGSVLFLKPNNHLFLLYGEILWPHDVVHSNSFQMQTTHLESTPDLLPA